MKTRCDRGLTLVETVVSVLVVGMALAGVGTAVTWGLSTIRATRESAAALQAAQQEIERLRNSPFAAILTRSFTVPAVLVDANGSTVSGSTVVNSVDYDLNVDESIMAPNTPLRPKKVSVSIAWVSGGRRNMRVSLLTVIANGGIDPAVIE